MAAEAGSLPVAGMLMRQANALVNHDECPPDGDAVSLDCNLNACCCQDSCCTRQVQADLAGPHLAAEQGQKLRGCSCTHQATKYFGLTNAWTDYAGLQMWWCTLEWSNLAMITMQMLEEFCRS